MAASLSFLTPDDLLPLLTEVRAIRDYQQAAARPADDYLSIDQVAALAGATRKTVSKWLSEGKFGANGQRITLFYLEFHPGHRRVPRSALLAFGQGLAYDASQLQLPPAAAAPVLDSRQALRRAS